MNSTQDKINGTMNTAAGSIKKAVSEVTGNETMKNEAAVQTIKGETQKTSGAIKDAIHQGLQASGDAIEMVGEKLEAAGFKKLGEAVHKAGDTLEHLAD